MFDIVQVFTFARLSPGDRLQVYESLRAVVALLNADSLLALIDRGMVLEREAIHYENQWTGVGRRATFGPEVVEIDEDVDYHTGVIYRVLSAHAMGDPERDPLVASAQRLLAEIFPSGLAAITKLPYVRQVGALEVIVNRLQTEFPAEVANLGLQAKVEYLAERTVAYRQAITTQAPETTFAQVQDARDKGRRFFCRVLAQILASYYDEDNATNMGICEKLMAHVNKQDEQYRGRRRARRARSGAGGTTEDANAGADEGAEDEDAGGSPQAG